MWQRKALESHFEKEGLQHAFLELLRVVAYNMSNGPWRGLWVRYGYDPSLDPVARFYQALDVRWKEAGLEKVKRAYEQVRRKGEGKRGDGAAAKDEEEAGAQDGEGREGEEVAGPQAGGTVSELQLFGLPVRRQMVFQLCDLGGASLQELVLGLPRKALCSPQGGWFRLSDLNRLRVRIKRYLSSRVAECVRMGSLEAVVGPEEGALSSSAMIKEAEARRGREVVWREDDFKKGAGVDRDQEGWPERHGGMAMTRRSSKRASAEGGGRKSAEVREGERGVRRNGKRARRAALRQAEERQDEVSEWEDDRELDGGEGGSLRGGQEDEEGEEDEERGLRHLGDLLGQPMGGIKSSRGDRRTTRAGRQSSGGRVEEVEDTDELGGNFVIPLTAGEMENASSIRLLGGYQGGDYSSSSSTEEDEGAESD
jgi:general transcription factor 3C polypeptide 5 (transcription factor C subunit 1)